MNKYMTRGEFEDFIHKHAPNRAKNYSPARFARWFLAFGQELDTATKVWKSWNNMSLSQCAYLDTYENQGNINALYQAGHNYHNVLI